LGSAGGGTGGSPAAAEKQTAISSTENVARINGTPINCYEWTIRNVISSIQTGSAAFVVRRQESSGSQGADKLLGVSGLLVEGDFGGVIVQGRDHFHDTGGIHQH
jgi:hypothetical protein